MESIKEFKPILEVECQCHKDFYSDIKGLGYATERSLGLVGFEKPVIERFVEYK